jgi:hypothetical protein
MLGGSTLSAADVCNPPGRASTESVLIGDEARIACDFAGSTAEPSLLQFRDIGAHPENPPFVRTLEASEWASTPPDAGAEDNITDYGEESFWPAFLLVRPAAPEYAAAGFLGLGEKLT